MFVRTVIDAGGPQARGVPAPLDLDQPSPLGAFAKLGGPKNAGTIGPGVEGAGPLDPLPLLGSALKRDAPLDDAIVAARRPARGHLPRALALLNGRALTLCDGARPALGGLPRALTLLGDGALMLPRSSALTLPGRLRGSLGGALPDLAALGGSLTRLRAPLARPTRFDPGLSPRPLRRRPGPGRRPNRGVRPSFARAFARGLPALPRGLALVLTLGTGFASLVAIPAAIGDGRSRHRRGEQQGEHGPFHSTHSSRQFEGRMRRAR